MAIRATANTPQKIVAWVNLSTFASNLLLHETVTEGSHGNRASSSMDLLHGLDFLNPIFII
jgi:hypothetical protein